MKIQIWIWIFIIAQVIPILISFKAYNIEDKGIKYTVKKTQNGWLIQISESVMKESPAFGKIFRQAFRKAAYCSGCKVCETNCKNGRISFETGKVKITDCLHCHECHDLPGGCLMYNSLKMPQGEIKDNLGNN